MTTDEILCALDALAVQTGSLACLGCGHEHNCGIHGCAIIREAGKIIRWLSTDNTALRYAINPAKVKRSQEQNFNGAVAYMRALIEEQRAQIEKAEAENAVLREKVPQWISVEDSCRRRRREETRHERPGSNPWDDRWTGKVLQNPNP